MKQHLGKHHEISLLLSQWNIIASNTNQVAVIPAILLANELLFACNLQTITINAFSQCQAIAPCLQDLVWHVELVSIARSIISTILCVTILIVDVCNASDVILMMLIILWCFIARINDPSSNTTTKTDECTLNLERAPPVAATPENDCDVMNFFFCSFV